MPRGEANRPAVPAFSSGVEIAEVTMALPVEDPKLRRDALAYVIRIYDELTTENGAPTLGTQNQAVDFILANPELRRAVAQWAASINIDEASAAPRRGFPTTSFISRFAPILERSWGSRRDRRLPERLSGDCRPQSLPSSPFEPLDGATLPLPLSR